MNKVTQAQIVASLEDLGIESGDGLLVHSALQYLGIPEGGTGMYLDALQSVLGPVGTIAVPTFNFAFSKGEDYDPLTAPSVGMGAFSEYVRQYPDALRSAHPMQSLAMIGRHAQDLAGRDTPSAFDDGSAFDRMLELEFKLLFLGADIDASAMFHYVEQRVEVPYRYWKDFSARYRHKNIWKSRTYRMFVRDMNLDPKITLTSVEHELGIQKQWQTLKLNYGAISTVSMKNFVSATTKLLEQDPWHLVINRPVDEQVGQENYD